MKKHISGDHHIDHASFAATKLRTITPSFSR